MYSVQKFLFEEFVKSGLTRKELAYNMNYNDLEKGTNLIRQFFRGEYFDEDFVYRLAGTLGADSDLLQQAYNATKTEIMYKDRQLVNEEYRIEKKYFIPYIFIVTKHSSPRLVSKAGMCKGSMPYIKLDDSVLSLPDDAQMSAVSKKIQEHYEKSDGSCPEFGSIERYHFMKEFETSIIFDKDGEELETVERHELGRIRPQKMINF